MFQQNVSLSVSTIDTVQYYIYSIEGALLILLNLPLAMVIFVNIKLRDQKEHVMFALTMIFDVIFGFTYLYAGVFRLLIYYTEQYIPIYNAWNCFNIPFNYGFFFITPGAGLLTLAIAFDRLYSVIHPIRYFKLSVFYAYLTVSAAVIGSMPTFIISAVLCYQGRDIYYFPKTCNIQIVEMPFLFYGPRGTRIVSTLLAVIIYIPICLRIYCLINSNRSVSHSNSRKKFIRMTFTILLITSNQFILFGLSDIYILIFPYSSTPSIFYLMNLNKGVVNIFIFLFTQRELRKAVLSTLKLKRYQGSAHASITRIRETFRRQSTKIDALHI